MLDKIKQLEKVLSNYAVGEYTFDNVTKILVVEELNCKNIKSSELKLLNMIEEIEGSLIIDSSEIEKISTFNNLKSLKNLTIKNMNNLISITGFNSLESIESLIIENNSVLKEIYGFNKLFFCNPNVSGVIKVINNNQLTNVAFLRGLKRVNSSFYLHYNSLISLQGLESLEYVNASLSLSSNNLTSLKELSNLKYIDGMIGVVNNRLESLDGLENLKHLKTIKWSGKDRTIALNGNANLKDISALENVETPDSFMILLCDNFYSFINKPKENSSFYKNSIEIQEKSNSFIIGSKLRFPKIRSISCKNAISSNESLLENLIQGSGIGFEKNAPFGSISRKGWSTINCDKKYNHYFEQFEPIVIDLYLYEVESFDAIGIWSSRVTFGNSVEKFSLEFLNSKEKSEFSKPIYKTASDTNPFEVELFTFDRVEADQIRFTILSNHHNVGLGGKCVDFQEIAVISDVKKIQEEIENSVSNVCKYDFIRPLIDKSISDDEYFILNIAPEFTLDNIWEDGMSYYDFIKARGYNGIGSQLKRIELSKWSDKIYTYLYLKENGIKGMPVRHFSNKLDDVFMEKVKEQYNEGLNSFVLKVTHLCDSIGIYRVKDGLHIAPNETWSKNYMHGKKVDFNYLEKELKKHWDNRQYHEDWVSNMISPGVILEELVEDPTELKFSVVFGKVVGFFIRKKGFPSFDREGNALKDKNEKLPFWWKDALHQAERVAKLIRADHLRVDFFYNKGEIIVCELNWNGGERLENHEAIAKRLNYGYRLRKKYLEKEMN